MLYSFSYVMFCYIVEFIIKISIDLFIEKKVIKNYKNIIYIKAYWLKVL